MFTEEPAQGVSTPLPGDWNKENVLAASLLAEGVGVSGEAVRQGVLAVRQVPGRMEWVRLNDQFPMTNDQLPRVLIDYAVTPGALDRLYEYVRGALRQAQGSQDGRIIAILGAAGRRDRGKRPSMARAVARYADEIVLTREDPWAEDEEQIFSDLEKGLVGSAIPWRRIVDRREAIAYCLQKARQGDVVVVTGKGAERGMGVGKKIISWSDKKIVLELLNRKYRNVGG